ncbi:Predicted arabinose efflux permease, MFS family [Yoonia tamlensis]|uniref:Predicted arabinose efflux permease, MFS family n=1 Tax=Yoonia tamlensis TaxID=390270 RepID=A0A1I6HHG8_9RHOB|nr:MFS transporter [Yoonia tamlensis]SFR53814.1 Predicted arabinose efflux permease, MFS family [Yoonia tamlensis]
MNSYALYLRFLRENAPFLAVGALLSFLSSFGQTFLIAAFAGEIRTEYGLSNGDWGLIYMAATMVSAGVMVFAGGLTDRFRVRTLSVVVLGCLALSCIAMALNTHVIGLIIIIFCLRFFGQGMTSTISIVSISRWFIATRGRALAISTLGFVTAEAALPLSSVWLKSHLPWRMIWMGFAGFILLMIPLLWHLLKLERTPQATAKTDNAAGMDGAHWTRAQALRHPLFWTLAPVMALFPMFATTFWFHQVHFAEIKGWEHLSLVAVFPLGTFTFMGSTFLFGWAVDRFGVAKLLPLYLLPYSVAFIIHAYAPTIAWSALGVILMGLAGGGQATLPGSVWSTYYGTAHIGSIKSAAVALMVLGSAIGPGMSGWLIDAGVGFETQLLIYSATFVIGSIVMIPALRAATIRLPRAP